MTIKPNATFQTIRADEVAECWPGITDELYCALWNKIVPLQKQIPNREDSGPHDHVGFENLAAHWNKLTTEEQTLLNKLADEHDKEFQQLTEELDTSMKDLRNK